MITFDGDYDPTANPYSLECVCEECGRPFWSQFQDPLCSACADENDGDDYYGTSVELD